MEHGSPKMNETPAKSFEYYQQLCRFCCICKNELFCDSDPYLLPCLHTCCGHCLRDVKSFEDDMKTAFRDVVSQTTCNANGKRDNSVRCLECNESFTSSQCIQNVFLLNYFVVHKKGRRITEVNEAGKQSDVVNWDSYKSCASCEETTEFSAFCKDCDGPICGGCFKQHGTMKAFKNHSPVERTLGSNTNIECFIKKFSSCKIHPKEVYKLYCLVCDTVLCKECLINFHKDHRWENIDEMQNLFLKEIDSSIRNISEKRELVESSLRVLEHRTENLNIQHNTVRDEIVSCANSLKEAVDDLSQSLFEELQKHCEKRKNEYAKSQENLRTTEESLSFIETFLNGIVDDTFPVGLLYTKKIIETQISNLLQKQCFNPNSNENFELKLLPNMVNKQIEKMIKSAYSISSSKNAPNSSKVSATEAVVNSGGERMVQKRSSDNDVEFISSLPAKRQATQNPLAACKHCVESVPCSTSASLSYTTPVPQSVPNYTLHSSLAMASSSTAFPVMFAGPKSSQSFPQPQINQIQSAGAPNNIRGMRPPSVSLQHQPPPMRYSSIPNCPPSLLPRSTVSQPIMNNAPSALLSPNVYITNGIFDAFQQINFPPHPNQMQPQPLRRDNRARIVGSGVTHQQPSQMPAFPTPVVSNQNIAVLVSQAKQSTPLQPNIQRGQREGQVLMSRQRLMEQKKVAQKQSVQLVTLLPPTTEAESISHRQNTSHQNGLQMQDVFPQSNKVSTSAQNVENCLIYPPTTNGQQNQSTSRQTSTSSGDSGIVTDVLPKNVETVFNNVEPAKASMKSSEKSYIRVQSPPSPPAPKSMPTLAQLNLACVSDSVASSVTKVSQSRTEPTNGIGNISQIGKPMVSTTVEVATEVVSESEKGYKITFTPAACSGLSSDTEIMQETSNDNEDEEEETESDEYCSVCKDGGELICCEKCPRAFHMQCHVPRLQMIPTSAWTCQLCTKIQSGPSGDHFGPNASKVNEVALQRILLELFCVKETEVIGKAFLHAGLNNVKSNLEFKSNYNERDFIRDMNATFREFYSQYKTHYDEYERGIFLEKKFKDLVEQFLPQYKSMVKMKIWEIGCYTRAGKKQRII